MNIIIEQKKKGALLWQLIYGQEQEEKHHLQSRNEFK